MQKLIEFQNSQREFDDLNSLNNEATKVQDYNQFLFEELTNEKLTPGLLTPLEEEIDQLSNVEAIQHYLAQSIYLIDEEQIGLLTQFTSLKSLLIDAANQSKKLNFSYKLEFFIFS